MLGAYKLLIKGILQGFCTKMPFSCLFVTFLIRLIHGHNSVEYWLGPSPMHQNCMENSNLKSNVRYEVHNNVKFNIFDNFEALFSLSHIRPTTFPHVPKSC